MTTRDISHVALMAAVIVALGLVPAIPLAAGVPITLQSMGVMLAGLVLGPKRGAAAVLVVVALVALGLPVLSGGRGGLGVFAGKTTGFLAGWLVGAFVTGWLAQRGEQHVGRLNSKALMAIVSASIGAMAGIIVWKLLDAFQFHSPESAGIIVFAVTMMLTYITTVAIVKKYSIDVNQFSYYTTVSIFGCIIIMHILGVLWNVVFFSTSPLVAFMLFSLPYIPGDIVKAIAAGLITVKVRQAVAIERK